MVKGGYIDLQEVWLPGPEGFLTKVRTGNKICWKKFEKMLYPARSSLKRLMNKCGIGPFDLLEITRIPAGLVKFTFIDENGNEQNIIDYYFTACPG